MAIQLSERAIQASRESDKQPQILVRIDGIDELFTTSLVGKYWKVGDPEVIPPLGSIGMPGLTVGGIVPIAGQRTFLSFDAGTSTTLQQQLEAEDGTASVSSMQLGFIDVSNFMTEIISPSIVVDDILGRGVEVFFGFSSVGFPDDFFKIHQGIVDEVTAGPGIVQMQIAHPEQIKRQDIFIKAETKLAPDSEASTELAADIDNVVTSITVVDASDFPLATEHENYIKINDEYIRYTGISGNTFTGCVRAQLGSPSQSHTAGDGVDSEYLLRQDITEVYVQDISQFLTRVLGPNGGYDSGFKSYVVIDDECIEYTGITGNRLTGCTRGALGTTAALHEADAGAVSMYRLTGTMNEVALKLYHSYRNGFFDQLAVENFVYIDPLLSVADAVFFKNIDLNDYGVFPGQYFTISGSGAGNNGTWLVEEVVVTANGSYLTATGTTFTLEMDSPAQCSFRSQWDVWPDGCQIHPKFIDLERHDLVDRTFLSSFAYDFYVKDTMDAKEFIDKQVYMPASAYSLPRGGKISLGYHAPPIPSQQLQIIGKTKIINPDELTIKRGLGKSFYNGIVFKFDADPIQDEFFGGAVVISATSQTRIPVGNRISTIESEGLRSSSLGLSQALSSAQKRLNRYQFGAEYIEQLKLFFELITVEAGDILLVDFTDLQVADSASGTRVKPSKLFEVTNRTIDIQNGMVEIEVLDTNFSTATRYGLVSPSSYIRHSATQKQFTIDPSFNSRHGDNEFRKWEDWIGAMILVRSPDSVTRYAFSVLKTVSGNTITLENNLGFLPVAGDVMELYEYDTQTDNAKLVWGFMRDGLTFADGKPVFGMI
jgi:hypothetical protein